MLFEGVQTELLYYFLMQTFSLTLAGIDKIPCMKHDDCKVICEVQDITKYQLLDRAENLRADPYWVSHCVNAYGSGTCNCKVWYRDVNTGFKCDSKTFTTTGQPCIELCSSIKPPGVGVAAQCGKGEQCLCIWSHLDLKLEDLNMPIE